MVSERLLGLARSALTHRLLGPVAALGALVVALAIAVPLALGTVSDAFVLRSLDDARFVAEVRGSGDDWVLLGHQFPTHRHTWDRLADRLLEEGYRVMVWDFRCHGESPCVYSNAKNDDVPDDLAVSGRRRSTTRLNRGRNGSQALGRVSGGRV